MAWIELHQTLPSHRKLLRFKALLGLRTSQAVGHLCLLWLWALDNVRDGELGGIAPRELAQVMDFSPRRAEELLEALVDAGFLDRQGEGLRIHDWEDYAGRLLEMREKNAARKRRYRASLRERDGDETGTSAPVPGLPDPTVPDPTEAYQTEQKNFSAGDDARAGAAGERMRDYLLGRGLLPEGWLGSEPEMVAECRALGDALFHSFADRGATEADQAKVFQWVMRQWQDGDGKLRCSIDEDKRALLHYAFEQAALAGHPGGWPYIQGILLRLHRRGITDLNAAEDYELERDGKLN